MKVIIAIFVILLGSISTLFAQDLGANFFTDHIKEAIVINSNRLPIYSKLTNGKSEKVSRSLILMEKMLLPIAKIIDMRTRQYLRNGIPLMKDEIVPMELPPFTSSIANVQRTDQSVNIKEFIYDIHRALNKSDFEEIVRLSNLQLDELEQSPNGYCLIRHFIESIRRSAALAPKQIDLADIKGLQSPIPIIKQFIYLHLIGLGWGKSIDEMAKEIQNEGIPIICQDIPYIPTP